jgi:uncharacterized membrane protein YqjE
VIHPSGADRPAPPDEPALCAAASDFASSAVRFVRALTGLFGLELRETGAQALVLALLAVALVACCVFAYVFLLAAAMILLVGLAGGGWLAALFGLFVLHALLALALALWLRSRARRPLFPGTREAVRREVERFS